MAVTAGRFTVGADGSITSPADYMASESFRACRARIEAGTHVLIGAAPLGTPVTSLIAVAFQTDYAAWLGALQLAALGAGR